MNVIAIHANMEQHAPMTSIDFNVTVCQGIVEYVVKMVIFPFVASFMCFFSEFYKAKPRGRADDPLSIFASTNES